MYIFWLYCWEIFFYVHFSSELTLYPSYTWPEGLAPLGIKVKIIITQNYRGESKSAREARKKPVANFLSARETRKLPVANFLKKVPVELEIARGNLGEKCP